MFILFTVLSLAILYILLVQMRIAKTLFFILKLQERIQGGGREAAPRNLSKFPPSQNFKWGGGARENEGNRGENWDKCDFPQILGNILTLGKRRKGV